MRSKPIRLLLLGAIALGMASAITLPASAGDVPGVFTWSTPVQIDEFQGGVTAMSCTPAGFCAAVDDSGQAMTFDGHIWSAPEVLSGSPAFLGFDSVSCRGADFCLASGDWTGLWEHDASGWHEASAYIDSDFGVSCGAVTDCIVASIDGAYLHRTTAGWSTSARIAPQGYTVTALSCARADFCMAALNPPNSAVGYVAVFDGISWSTPRRIDASASIISLSCTSKTFCLAGDEVGFRMRFDGTQWGPRRDSPIYRGYSCLSRHFCSGTAYSGKVGTWDGHSWSMAWLNKISDVGGVSCIDPTRCFAFEYVGYITPYKNGTWLKAERAYLDRTTGRVSDLSCANASSCLAVDMEGNVVRYADGIWGEPHRVDRFGDRFAFVECPTVRFCMALDGSTNGWFFSDGVWHGPDTGVASSARYGLSCTPRHFCMSFGYFTSPTMFHGKDWTRAPGADRALPLASLSCASARFCLAVSESGLVLRFDGTRWQPGRQLPVGYGDWSVSCPSAQFCAVTNGTGEVFFRTSGLWTSTDVVGVGSVDYIVCSSATFCLIRDTGQLMAYDGVSWHGFEDVGMSVSVVTCPGPHVCVATDGVHASIGTRP